MMRGISTFTNLPTPLKVGLVVASGGGGLAVFRLIFSPSVFWIVLIGLALVALLLMGYWRLLKFLKKRKAAPMEQDLLKSSSATPQGISEPANVAKLDDLRKKFEEGTRKFQSAGKSLYNFPWYVIVGEPGSGKTEAIRHCNVGFPPGLQDEFQGTGGTINMNWWFTDHAVILDTAGRLMFEEVETGGSKEWREFLNLMKKYRPRCPINGVLLVIPADSLIRDTADQIEQKASKIARQFDVIQRTLDVRFPVFVVVTKSDLINGFRDFFDNLQDPQLQHQMLGWSNPAPLDEPYNPDFVDQHLKTIQGRLFRRRLALLHEAMSEEPGVEKIRTADTLYAFPQSIAKIAPRMARYLELIFSVGSQWSCKPLFFRGIYFTSSMREGSALDEDLAESLGVPVDSLPDGRVWERDRAYFLRDLFVKKIFREQGLVTYATNAKSLHRRRKTAVLVSGAVSVILLLFFTFYAAGKFSKSIGEMQEYFGGLARLMENSPREAQNQLQVIKKVDEEGYRYIGRNPIPGMPGEIKRSNVSARLADAVVRWEKKGIPWIFKLAAKFARRITPDKLKDAQGVLYEVGVLQPFIQVSRNLMDKQENIEWMYQNPETQVLRQLIQLKANKPLNDAGGYSAQTFLDPFFEYVFSYDEDIEEEEDFKKRLKVYNEDKAELHRPLEIIYGEAWPPSFLKAEPNVLETAIKVDLYNAFWNAQSEQVAQVETIKKLTNWLERFDDAEGRIIDLKDSFDKEGDPLVSLEQQARAAFVSDWNGRYDELSKAKKSIDDYARSLGNPPLLAAWWATAAKNAGQDVVENYKFLLDELDPNELAKGSFLADVRIRLEGQRDAILKRLRLPELEQRLKALDEHFYTRVRDRAPLYEIRFEMYSKANDQLSKSESISGIDEVTRAMDQVDTAVKKAQLEIDELRALKSDGFRVQEAAGICELAVKLGGLGRYDYVVKSGLEEAIKRIRMLVELPAGESYDPNVAIPIIRSWKRVGDWLVQPDLPKAENVHVKQKYDEAYPKYAEYTKGYIDYWLVTKHKLWMQDHIPLKENWEAQHKELEKLDVLDVFFELDKFGKSIEGVVLDKLESYISDVDVNMKVKQFRDNLKKLNVSTSAGKLLERKCERLLEKWGELSDDAFEVRNTLLRNEPDNLIKYYFFSGSSAVEFVDRYWDEMAHVSLRVLANEIQREGGKAFNTLRAQYGNKFPLARESTQDLTLNDLKETHSLLRRALSLETYDKETVGGGMETEIDQVNVQLKRLREPPAPKSLETWVDGIKQVFRGLPKGGSLYYCKISVLSRDEHDKYLLENEKYLPDKFPFCKLVQGDEINKQIRLRGLVKKEMLGIVKYPYDEPVEFLFYESAVDENPQHLEFPKLWACLKMLHEYSEPDKGKGYIKLDKKELPGVLWLQLEFSKESDGTDPISFPKTNEWPSSKK
ncbi:MAG: type VI secretion protein IcmF/TssM N-terminal domain-containing protein [Sedimentisphaerales bacterium]